MATRWISARSARWRDWVAAAVAVLALTLGILTLAVGRLDPIIHLEPSNDGRVVVSEVDANSIAWEAGLRPGMFVQALNSVTLIQLPQYVYPSVEPTPDPATGEIPTMAPIGTEPALPTNVPMSEASIAALLAAPVADISAIQPWDLDHGTPDAWMTIGFYDGSADALRQTTAAVFLGAALMLVLGWWLASGRAGEALRPMAIPLAVATSVPFLVRPLTVVGSVPLMATAGILTVLAMVPLAAELIERVMDPGEQRLVTIVSAACAVAGAMLAIVVARPGPWPDSGLAQWALIGAIPLVPGFAAAGPILPRDRRIAAASSGRLIESTGFAVVGATPFFAVASVNPPYVFPLGLWFLGIIVAGRFTVRPLARLASRATLQRDLVVAATEAERARVAADIHDDALQDLTLLVHRLDAAGDTEGADIARTVSDRLRAICGDLRLPILDDLGVGPALDWLVLRIERLAGGEVRLERSDGTRPPADVELAFFRIAQEALSNAVKHGSPPIVVRYSTSEDAASLSIDDAGPGIEADTAETTVETGHYGLLNMQQRAEAIGAILDVRRWPAGGTHVKLDWRAP